MVKNTRGNIISLDYTRAVAIPVLLSLFINSVGFVSSSFFGGVSETAERLTILGVQFDEHRKRFNRHEDEFKSLENRCNIGERAVERLRGEFTLHRMTDHK